MHDVLKVVKINGQFITALCDTGAEVNVLPKHAVANLVFIANQCCY